MMQVKLLRIVIDHEGIKMHLTPAAEAEVEVT